ncbi:hypothetical protein F5876DRAFT_79538 [Lentinula aff. lateritia]|uniref:Uncharacterized protein n=1 Tax=Lentinula aff. lateritia TaxID=2804960 RepID=A0ACC1TSA0_9AGAR|nr:hypothetical protein F5876DRAFT_79538 [Lentinula aff. lateritia]
MLAALASALAPLPNLITVITPLASNVFNVQQEAIAEIIKNLTVYQELTISILGPALPSLAHRVRSALQTQIPLHLRLQIVFRARLDHTPHP